MMSAKQKAEAVAVFGKGKRVNSIDYVGAWYHKAASFMQGTKIRTAFVSTNSITQGEQVAALWSKLLGVYGVHIDFAWRTFRWDSESTEKAAVHCVIIGFSCADNQKIKTIYAGDGMTRVADNINPYLLSAANVLLSARPQPICNVSPITYGNKPSDGGNLLLTEKEREDLLKKTPELEPYIRRYVGAKDFINNDQVRYCLWLKDASPNVYRKNAEVMRRLNAVREMREKSSAAPTRALANNRPQREARLTQWMFWVV